MRKTKLNYNGKTQCLWRWAEELNMPAATLYTRARRGWADYEIIEGRPKRDPANFGPTKLSTPVIYRGITYQSLTELSRATGVSYNTIYGRHYRGWTNSIEIVHGKIGKKYVKKT